MSLLYRVDLAKQSIFPYTVMDVLKCQCMFPWTGVTLQTNVYQNELAKSKGKKRNISLSKADISRLSVDDLAYHGRLQDPNPKL